MRPAPRVWSSGRRARPCEILSETRLTTDESFRGRILVIRGGAIGDFILTLPAIAALRRQFPDVCLEILGYPHIIQLALAGGLVNYTRSIEARALAGFFARNGELASDLVDYFSDFDLVVSYLYDPDEIFQTNVRRCSPAQFLVGPHRPDETAGVHATSAFLKPLERLAIFDADALPRLSIQSAASPLNVLALHPGSGSETKNWPEAKWDALISRLLEATDFELLLVGGEAEGERLQRLAPASRTASGRVRLARSLPLAELARLLESCAGYIGHDSGISHLAAALGLPGIILWGESREEIWRPLSPRIVVLRGSAGLSRLTLDRVWEQVVATLGHEHVSP